MQYIGARYVPKFLGTWDNTTEYSEPLCVVDNGLGTSYINGKPTPAGTPLTDTTYWHIYGATSGAIINLQNQIDDIVAKYHFITPEQYGAEGDGVTDDTAAINAMLTAASGSGKIALFTKDYAIDGARGTYWNKSGLVVKSNTKIMFASGAVIREIANNTQESVILGLWDVENVEIWGGKIIGDYATHTPSGFGTDEWCHGIIVKASKNVYIHDMTVKDCYGDGIYVGQEWAADVDVLAITNHCKNVRINNINVERAGRNGIVIGDCDGWEITNCRISNVARTDPKSAIDIEQEGDYTPYVSDGICQNILTESCDYSISVSGCNHRYVLENISGNRIRFVTNPGAHITVKNANCNIVSTDNDFECHNCNFALFTINDTTDTHLAKFYDCDIATSSITAPCEFDGCTFHAFPVYHKKVALRNCHYPHDEIGGAFCLKFMDEIFIDNCVFENLGVSLTQAIYDGSPNGTRIVITNCRATTALTSINHYMITSGQTIVAYNNCYYPFLDFTNPSLLETGCVNFNR